ncbi:outer membrane protein assembly factor BamA [Endomicrobiia bacterium]|nr:outer membrane protein assembly factor BamA [Endomicrobiia bacterium]
MKIRWVLVFFMMFFTSYICAAESDVITKVEVKGSFRNVRPERILRATKLKRGKPYSVDAVKKDVGAIMSLDFIENVEFSYDKGKGVLTFTVVEKRYKIDAIIFNIFKGKNSKGFTAKELEKISSLKKGEYYNNSEFDKTKKDISKLYKDNGYSDCHIQGYPTDNLDTNKITVTFLITENSQTRVGGVDIKGVTSFKKNKILGLMKKIRKEKAYSEKLLEEDKSKIEEFYKGKGFMDYRLVSSPTIYNEEKTKVFLTLNISEGSKYKIGKITHGGNLSVDDKKIKKLIKLKKNQIFNDDEIRKTEGNIRDFYANRGYIYANIDYNCSNKDATNGTIDINFSIQENHPVYVGSINIDGLKSTKRSFIERELLLKQGDLLEANKLAGSIQKLRNLGFIEAVECQQSAVGKSDTVDLTLDIVESSAANISCSIGTGGSGLHNFFGGVQVKHKNILGRGQTAVAYTQLGKKDQTYGLSWGEPWILNKNASLSLGYSYSNEEKDIKNKTDAYKVGTHGAECKIGHRVDENISFSGGYKFEHVRFFDIKEEAKYWINDYYGLSKPKDKTNISSIIGDGVYDSRDYHLDPSTGNLSRLYAQLASRLLVGDVNFLKLGAKTTWYFPTFWKLVLSINMEGCTVMPYGDQKRVPIIERFDDSVVLVRGYDEKGEIGSDEFGGRIKGLMNIECKCPIFPQNDKTIIQGIVFYDIGGIWNDWKDMNLKIGSENNNLHSSLGFGIKIMTPLGPFRLDVARGFNHSGSKKRGWTLHFSTK